MDKQARLSGPELLDAVGNAERGTRGGPGRGPPGGVARAARAPRLQRAAHLPRRCWPPPTEAKSLVQARAPVLAIPTSEHMQDCLHLFKQNEGLMDPHVHIIYSGLMVCLQMCLALQGLKSLM